MSYGSRRNNLVRTSRIQMRSTRLLWRSIESEGAKFCGDEPENTRTRKRVRTAMKYTVHVYSRRCGRVCGCVPAINSLEESVGRLAIADGRFVQCGNFNAGGVADRYRVVRAQFHDLKFH